MACVFGYGSLISASSRAATAMTSEGRICKVAGLRRGWNKAVSRISATALGVVPNVGATTNGVIVTVAASELPQFDEREGGYRRLELNPRDVDLTVGDYEASNREGFWTYVPINPQSPTSETPIIQSYVDVVLDGCLDYGEPFARDFVISTDGWTNPWVNDRSDPRYPRALALNPRCARIDELLSELVPEAFQRRQTI